MNSIVRISDIGTAVYITVYFNVIKVKAAPKRGTFLLCDSPK